MRIPIRFGSAVRSIPTVTPDRVQPRTTRRPTLSERRPTHSGTNRPTSHSSSPAGSFPLKQGENGWDPPHCYRLFPYFCLLCCIPTFYLRIHVYSFYRI